MKAGVREGLHLFGLRHDRRPWDWQLSALAWGPSALRTELVMRAATAKGGHLTGTMPPRPCNPLGRWIQRKILDTSQHNTPLTFAQASCRQ